MTKIDIQRLKENLMKMAQIGKDPRGGITRLAYSEEYYQGTELVKELMKDAGLTVEMDSVGNVLGRKQGKTDKIILVGSHTDTVENGGPFDGTLGVLGAIEVMKSLNEAKIGLDHTVIVANWAEEEGNVIKGLVGSGSFVGKMDQDISAIRDKLQTYGITAQDIRDARCKELDNIECYLELHIEQGGILDRTGTNIGIVNSIVGEDRYMVTLYGKENHAGTTPMEYRDDALIKAARLMLDLNSQCRIIDDTMVCTVGWIKALPGEQNIVPGEVQMTVEMRSVNQESIDTLADYMKRWCEKEPHDIRMTLSQNSVKMSDLCMDAVREAVDDLGLSGKVMASGAGHDAMMIANVIPNTGMIFAPSVGGVSHCPEEWTEWDDIENSVNVLLRTIVKLDQRL